MTEQYQEVVLKTLKPDPANARMHNERNIAEIARSLEEFGQHAPLVVQRSTNRVLIGNGRLEAMKQLGWEKALVMYVDDDNVTAVRRSLADNRTAELAEWDDEVLRSLIESLGPDDVDIPGWSNEELEAMLGIAEFGDVDGIDAPGLKDGDREPFQQMTFTLHDDQAEEVKRAMNKAKAEGGGESGMNENSNGNALAFIAEAFNRG